MEGIVVKKIADLFTVRIGSEFFVCKPRGNLKQDGIFVGDKVEILKCDKIFVIEKVMPRKNLLVRPPISNLDQLLIVVSPIPKPDFYMVDKLLLFAYSYGIEPIIIVNKQDLSDELNDYISHAYFFVEKVYCSAKDGQSLNKLKPLLENKISSFAGQSAVGKSALVNALCGENKVLEGLLSERIERGKNTTRHCEIYTIGKMMIADTAGFTSLDETLLPIPYYELALYYPDYVPYKNECKYTTCMHYGESSKDCKIKQLVLSGKLDKERFLRYKTIYKNLEEKWVRTHG